MSFDDEFFTIRPELTHSNNYIDESPDELCSSGDDADPIKALLSFDDSIFEELQFEQDNEEGNDKSERTYHNKSKLFLNETLQDSISDGDDLVDSNVNNPISRLLNCNNVSLSDNTVNLLENHFFETSEEIIPRKKFRTGLNCSNDDETNTGRRKNENNAYYGLSKKVEILIEKYKGIKKLYDWQDQCLNSPAVINRKNLIYALPTSGGKTLVAEILMLKEVVCNKKNAIFILPFVALVQEKIQSMTPFGLELNFLIEEYAAEKGKYPPTKRRKKNSIYICTIEKAQTVINCLIELNRLDEVGVIVVDELHLLGEDGGRGATLECLLTKVMHVNSQIHIIGMSATIGNLKEISAFLNADIFVQNFRPVAIKEYVKCENEIWLVDKTLEEIFTDKKIISYPYSDVARQRDPDFLGGLVMDVVPKDSCLIFCSTKKNCENVAVLLTQVMFKSLEHHKAEDKNWLLGSLESESGRICPILNKTIKFGVAYHHSGLIAEERRLLEDAFKSGILCVLCCTSTLAAGVNLPARRVILRSPFVGTQFLNASRYKQMIGRAGRAGLNEVGESILICSKQNAEKVYELMHSKINDAVSSIHHEIDRGINNLIISSVLLSIATTRLDIHIIVSKTLLKVQEKRLGINVKEITDKALSTLLKSGIIRVKQKVKSPTCMKLNSTIEFPSQVENEHEASFVNNGKKEKVQITDSTELELCPLGKAALQASIDLNTAYSLYRDLCKATHNLVIADNLHLLYLVTPYDIANQVKPVGVVIHDVMLSLTEDQKQVARFLGLNEGVIQRLRAGMNPKNVDMRTIQRFYVTLMLHELWNQTSIFSVSEKYQVNRGTIQNLLSLTATFANSAVRFCKEMDELWAFTELLKSFSHKLTYCCAAELEPLMDLPHVKIGRAKQLYKAGYKTLKSIASAKPEEMLQKIEHLRKKVVLQIISSAKMLLLEKAENLRDEVEEVLDGLDL